MATRYSVPSAAGWDMTSTTNWSSSRGGAGGSSVPVDGDTMVLDSAFMPGAGLSQPTVQLAALYIMESFGGASSGLSLGTASAPLEIDATDVYIVNSRLSFIKLSGAYTNVYARVLGGATLYLTVGSLVGAATNIYAGTTGTIDIGDDMEVSVLKSSGATVLIRADSTSAPDLAMKISKGARVECWRKVTTAHVDGSLTLAYAASIAGSGTPEVTVGSGGKLDLRSSGSLTQIEVLASGTLIANQTPGFATPPTLSTLILHDGHIKNIPTSALTVSATVEAGGYGVTNQAST